MFSAGDCLLIETNESEGGRIVAHLHVVLLDPQEHTHNTIIVCIETLNSEKQDQTTLLTPGEHDFIVTTSYVNYRRARICSTDDLDQSIEKGAAHRRAPASPALLEKIRRGLLRSRLAPIEVCELYQDFLHGQAEAHSKTP